METDFTFSKVVFTIEPEVSLVDVSGEAGIANLEVIGGDKACELEELD